MEINTLKTMSEIDDLKEKMAGLLDLFYPVGTYYDTDNANFDPNISWGGVWVKNENEASFLMAASENELGYSLGKTGGKESVTLTEKELPGHRHSPGKSGDYYFTLNLPLTTDTIARRYFVQGKKDDGYYCMSANANAADDPKDMSALSEYKYTNSVGSGNAFSIVPKFKAVNRWHRIE